MTTTEAMPLLKFPVMRSLLCSTFFLFLLSSFALAQVNSYQGTMLGGKASATLKWLDNENVTGTLQLEGSAGSLTIQGRNTAPGKLNIRIFRGEGVAGAGILTKATRDDVITWSGTIRLAKGESTVLELRRSQSGKNLPETSPSAESPKAPPVAVRQRPVESSPAPAPVVAEKPAAPEKNDNPGGMDTDFLDAFAEQFPKSVRPIGAGKITQLNFTEPETEFYMVGEDTYWGEIKSRMEIVMEKSYYGRLTLVCSWWEKEKRWVFYHFLINNKVIESKNEEAEWNQLLGEYVKPLRPPRPQR